MSLMDVITHKLLRVLSQEQAYKREHGVGGDLLVGTVRRIVYGNQFYEELVEALLPDHIAVNLAYGELLRSIIESVLQDLDWDWIKQGLDRQSA